MSKELQDKLKRARAKLRLTQADFAQRIGVPLRTLESWEMNRTTPRGYTLTALEKELDRILNRK